MRSNKLHIYITLIAIPETLVLYLDNNNVHCINDRDTQYLDLSYLDLFTFK